MNQRNSQHRALMLRCFLLLLKKLLPLMIVIHQSFSNQILIIFDCHIKLFELLDLEHDDRTDDDDNEKEWINSPGNKHTRHLVREE